MGAAFDKLEDWLEARGYALIPGKSYICWYETKQIEYRPGDPQRAQLNGILHECGHVLVNRTLSRGRGTRYLRGYPSERTHGARPNVSAADLVHEEIEAWHRGFALARRLRIRLDAKAYWRDYGMCVKRYFARALKRVV